MCYFLNTMMIYVYRSYFLFTPFYFNLTKDLLTDFRERGRGREERKKDRDLFFLHMHSFLLLVYILTRDSTETLAYWGNALSN